MKCIQTRLTGILIGASLSLGGGVAQANLVDTLTGQIPGHEIGCRYTFSNGDPSIPCAPDIVAADGTVRFVKPNAPFDGIEYFDLTLPDPPRPISSFFDVFFDLEALPDPQYPILRPQSQPPTFGSFFDVFVEIDMQAFNDDSLHLPGVFEVGRLLEFIDGTNSSYASIRIPGFTGTAIVVGFDRVSVVPEPGTLALLVIGLAGLGYSRPRPIRPTHGGGLHLITAGSEE